VLDNNGVANSDGQQRPDLIGDPNAAPCVPGTFFNTCAYANPAAGSFGIVAGNTQHGPGYQICDFSVFRSFPIKERARLELRAEFFNGSIIPTCSSQSLVRRTRSTPPPFDTPEFGSLTAACDPRQMQLALKLSF
jgi:hypothetical protein